MAPRHTRASCLLKVAEAVQALIRTHPVRVAVDGRTASGKTTFADDLANVLRSVGRDVIRTSVDGFHRPKEARVRTH